MAEDTKPAAPGRPVKIMLMCDHLFLPEDPTAPNWEGATDTKRYEGKDGKSRVRLDVHPTLAAFLKDREQAEIL